MSGNTVKINSNAKINRNLKTNNNGNKSVNNQTIEKVLVVVDFQNGFIKGGSFGYHNQNLKNLSLSIEQSIQVENLIDKNENIIFTRDFHPINHLSIGVPNKVRTNHFITWPSHCINNSFICPRNHNAEQNKSTNNKVNYGLIKENINKIHSEQSITINEYLNKYSNKANFSKLRFDPIILLQPIIGTNISFLMLATKYAPQILSLIVANKPIGIPLKTAKSGVPNFSLIEKHPFVLNSGNKTFVELVKGQLCRYESYSAFNYHLKIKLARTLSEGMNKKGTVSVNNNGKEIINNGLATYSSEYITKNSSSNKNTLQNLSTGLFEYILESKKNNIEITVCGLVGEVCVVNSVTEGLIMWNNLYKAKFPLKKVIFNYSLTGTLFTGLDILEFSGITPDQSAFFDQMCNYLNKYIAPEFKQYIQFNVIGYNGNYCGTINFNGESFVYSYTKITFANVNNNNYSNMSIAS